MLSAILKVLPVVLPIVFDAVRFVEKLFGSGKGEEKRSAAVEVVKIAVMAVEGISGKDLVENEEFAEGVGMVVDGVVKILNASGVFKKENLG